MSTGKRKGDQDMPRFAKGHTLATGRPAGSRNKSTLVFDEIGREGIADTIRMVKRKADKEGSLRAAAILLARTWPRGRGRPVALDLPPVETAAGVVQAHAAVVAAMAAQQITPEEAKAVADVLESQRRAIETHDHDKRLQALEQKKAEGPNPFDEFK
jgi:hypothetical protein